MNSGIRRPLLAAAVLTSLAFTFVFPIAPPQSRTHAADEMTPPPLIGKKSDKEDTTGADADADSGPDMSVPGYGDSPKTKEKKDKDSDPATPAGDNGEKGEKKDKPDRPPIAEDVQRKKADELLTFLEGQYEKKMDSQDWVSRALATLSIARSPRATATKRMFEVMERDKHPVVKLIAWQALLGRASHLGNADHQRWMKATLPMAEKGYFNGGLRIPLLQFLATDKPTAQTKKIYGAIFDTCNAWEPTDIPTLDALGKCLGTWKDKSVAEALVKRLTDPDACVRAEYVLRLAGADAKPARELVGDVFDPNAAKRASHPSSTELWMKTQAGYATWLKGAAAGWKTESREDDPWKSLPPKYVDPPIPIESVDYRDPIWKQDLELGRVNLTDFEVVFCVDATGSMGAVIDWLKRDVTKMMAALSNISTHPHLGLTFYRDTNLGANSFVTKVVPLTNNAKDLVQGLAPITADGGGDIPEAVLDGLDAAVKKSKWTTKGRVGSRAIVLIGDAPPHEKDVKKCLDLVKSWAGDGYRFYTVKVTSELANNDLSTFDQIAEAGRGSSVPAEFPRLSQVSFVTPEGKLIDLRTIDRPEAQLVVATRLPKEHPGELVLTQVLAGAMNPQFKNRVEPIIATLLAYSEQKPDPEKRKPFPANTPPLPKGMLKPQ